MTSPVIEISGLVAGYGGRAVLTDLDLEVRSGEMIAVLGPNGSGKTTLIKVLLGLLDPMAGQVAVAGAPPRPASRHVGYVPQHRGFERDLPIRGRELVELGLTGHRLGLPLPRRSTRAAVDAAIAEVGAETYADAPVGLLSGGEQQRLRIAQALLGDPSLLLCDEPLLALDPRRQREITALIDGHRRSNDVAVLFVTHEINPILPYVDRVLYLVAGRAAVGRPDEVLTTAALSALYDAEVQVLEVGGRILVLTGDEGIGSEHHHHDHEHEREAGTGPWG